MMVSRFEKITNRRRKDTKSRHTYFAGCQGQRERIRKSVMVFSSPFWSPFKIMYMYQLQPNFDKKFCSSALRH